MPLVCHEKFMQVNSAHGVRWTVKDWLPSATALFVIGPPGCWKTWMTADLAVSVASGKPFLGHWPVHEHGTVLMIQQEDFPGELAERLGLIALSRFGLDWGPGDDEGEEHKFKVPCPPVLPIIHYRERAFRFDSPEMLEALETRIAEHHPRMVIVDPLYAAADAESWMAKAPGQMLPLKRMRDRYGCSFVIVHHSSKGAGGDRGRMWGSVFLDAFLETGWQVTQTQVENRVMVRRHCKVAKSPGNIWIEFHVSTTDPYRYRIKFEDMEKPTSAETDSVLQMLTERGSLTAAQIADERKVKRAVIYRLLKQLERAGLIWHHKKLGLYSRSGATIAEKQQDGYV
jgi:hypothetical protein